MDADDEDRMTTTQFRYASFMLNTMMMMMIQKIFGIFVMLRQTIDDDRRREEYSRHD